MGNCPHALSLQCNHISSLKTLYPIQRLQHRKNSQPKEFISTDLEYSEKSKQELNRQADKNRTMNLMIYRLVSSYDAYLFPLGLFSCCCFA